MNDEKNFSRRLSDALRRSHLEDHRRAEKPEEETDTSGLRIGMEFVSGTLVGLGIGFALDKVFGTLPLFLIIFLVLGFAAGMLNIYRAVNNIPEGIGINRPAARRNDLTEDAKPPKSSSTD